jgi:putative acetyltransferase
MNIRIDDLSRPEVHALLNEHLAHMHSITPAESVHALPIDELRKPDITFWCAWDEAELLGCGALKELTPRHGEVKSMRTVRVHLRKGVARAILVHIIDEARRRAYERLSLETGSMAEFQPAVRLYASFGFASCPPFGDYIEDPNSLFMTKKLS